MKRYLFILLLATLIATLTLALSSCDITPSTDGYPPSDEGDKGEIPGNSDTPGSEAEHTHSPSASVKENVIEPTCYVKGSYDEVIYCSGCGTELERSNKESEKLSHSFDNGICAHCSEPKFSEGLWIDPNGDGTASLYGIGSCTDTDIVIPSRAPDGEPVTKIKPSAFEDLENITSIKIPDTVVEIELDAFKGCTSLKSIIIPDSVTCISGWLFQDCTSLTDVTLGNGIKEIPSCMFYGCESLTNVTIPDGVTNIDASAFYGCKALKSINIPESVETINYMAFFACFSLERIELPDGLTYLGEDAFSSCYALKEITIPSGITSIEGATFYDCESLMKISLPIGITDIDEYAFEGCDKLFTVYYAGSREDWDKIRIYPHNDPLGRSTLHCEGDNQK